MKIRVMLSVRPMSPLCPSKLIWLLKSPFVQNSIVIYHKANGDFKSHINFRGTQEGYKRHTGGTFTITHEDKHVMTPLFSLY